MTLSETFDAAENENILMEPTVDLHGTVIRPLMVGESAYPQKTWLLRPVKDNGTLTREQKKLSKARIVSEHAIGKMKGRWRVLEKRLDKESDRIPDTIIAASVLHNICTLRLGKTMTFQMIATTVTAKTIKTPHQVQMQHSKQLLIMFPIYSSKCKHGMNS